MAKTRRSACPSRGGRCVPLGDPEPPTASVTVPSAPVPTHAIGEIARRTGLTVRALRHYEAEGLLAPSARTDAGHRRYTDADVARLQKVVSLRAVGLPLADIRRLLDGPDAPDALSIVERHLAHVRTRLAAETALAARLGGLAAHLRRTGAADAETLLTLISTTTMFDRHYTPEQLERLKAQAETIGPDAIADVQRQWGDLFAHAARYREAGLDPAGPEMQALALRAETLIAAFTGGDVDIRTSLTNAVKTEPAEMYRAWGIDADLGAYYSRAMAALHAARRAEG